MLIKWGLDYILRIDSYFTINYEIQKHTLSNFLQLVILVGHGERVVHVLYLKNTLTKFHDSL